MKKFKPIIIIIIAALIVFVSILLSNSNPLEVPAGSHYKMVKISEVVKMYKSNKKTIFVFGQSECGYCKLFKPVISDAAEKYDIDIYYIEYDTITSADKNKIIALDDKLSSFGTPYTIVSEKGKIVDEISGYVGSEEFEQFLLDNGFIKEIIKDADSTEK